MKMEMEMEMEICEELRSSSSVVSLLVAVELKVNSATVTVKR